MKKIRVLLVDDHTIFRKGLRKLLRADKQITIIGEACNGREAVKIAQELSPDVIIMDIEMPGGSGIDATLEIKRIRPKAEIVALTAYVDDVHLFEAIKAGVGGYISKSSSLNELTEAIKTAFRGESVISPALCRRIISKFAENSENRDLEQKARADLSEREKKVLKCLCEAKTNQQIARELFISEKTARNHIYNLFKKLKCATRAEAVLKALEMSLVEPEE